eukprot:5896797-Pyramimonas_sp.AAC.1
MRRRPGGPSPVRRRDQLLGLQGLRAAERMRVFEVNDLLFNFLGLCEAVLSQDGAFLLEHPADLGSFPFPS